MNKNYFFSLMLISMFSSLLIISGCQVTEPDRYYDISGDMPSSFNITINGLIPNQHLAASRILKFNLASATDSLKELLIYVDTIPSASLTCAPYEYMLNPTKFCHGKHTLNVFAVAAKKGLNTVMRMKQLIYSVPFHCDTTCSKPITLNPVVYKNDHPFVTWTPNTDSNFYCYLILHNSLTLGPVTDTIYDQTVTSFNDINIPKVCGKNVNFYRVFVSNGYSNSESAYAEFSYASDLPFYRYSNVVINKNYDLFYSLNYSSLSVLSTIDNTVVRTIFLPQYSGETVLDASLSKDGKKLYIVSRPSDQSSTFVNIYNALTYSFIKRIDLKTTGSLKVNHSENRIYVVTDDKFNIVNSTNGALLKTVCTEVDCADTTYFDEQNNLLYKFGRQKYYALDVSNDSVKVISSILKNDNVLLSAGITVCNGSLYLAENSNTILEYDSRSLAVRRGLCLSATAVIKAIYSVNDYLYAGTHEPTGVLYHGKVYKVYLGDFTVKKQYIYTGSMEKMNVSRDGKYFYPFDVVNYSYGWFAVPFE